MALMIFAHVLMPVVELTYLTIYLIACSIIFIYGMGRLLLFMRRNKLLSQKEQSQIVKRHRYSLKWGFPIFAISAFIVFLFTRIFQMENLQIIGLFGFTFMSLSLVGIRVFMHNLKTRMSVSA